MNMDSTRHSLVYKAYILRVWRESEEGAWRASLQNAVTGKKTYFATLDRLCLFLLTLEDAL